MPPERSRAAHGTRKPVRYREAMLRAAPVSFNKPPPWSRRLTGYSAAWHVNRH
jgi:hypothetical protein